MFLPLLPADIEPIIDARDLVARLTIILSGVLGTYTTQFPSDPPLPAIYLVNDFSTNPPHNFISQGLECLIYTPHGYGQSLQHNSLFNEIYKIKLIQRDRASPDHTKVAQLLILGHFPDAKTNDLTMPNREMFEQLILTISQSKIVN